jgi:hypothetical protein
VEFGRELQPFGIASSISPAKDLSTMSFLKPPSLSSLKFLRLTHTETRIVRTNVQIGSKFSVGLSSRGRHAMGRFNNARDQAKATVNKTVGAIKNGISVFDPSNVSYHARNFVFQLSGRNTLRHLLKTQQKMLARNEAAKMNRKKGLTESGKKAPSSQDLQALPFVE